MFATNAMETLGEKFIAARERKAQVLGRIKANQLAYKDAEKILFAAMKTANLHHLHDSRHRCTINTSSADNALRVYSWKTSRIDGSLENDLAQLMDQFMDIREERQMIQTERALCEQELNGLSGLLCDSVSNITTLQVPHKDVYLKMIPTDRRVLVNRV
jgi:hypothetical protein